MDTPLSGKRMRLFIAIILPAEGKRDLSLWMNEAKKRLPFKRWVYPEDLHITLQFLGDTAATLLPLIRQHLTNIGRRTAPFSLSITGMATFGRRDFPRVLWAGIGGDLIHLNRLREEVAQSMAELTFIPEDRPYAPHITLARHYAEEEPSYPSLLASEGLLPPFPATEEKPLQFPVKEICLCRTHPGKSPMYEAIATATLTPPSSH